MCHGSTSARCSRPGGSRGHTALGERRRGRGSGISWTHPSPRASTVRLRMEPVACATQRPPQPGVAARPGSRSVDSPGRSTRTSRSGVRRAASVANASPASSEPQPHRPAAKPGTYRVPQWIGIATRAPTSSAASTAVAGPSLAGPAARPSARPAGGRHRRDRPAPPSRGRGPYPRRSTRASSPRSGTRSVAPPGAAASVDAGRGRRSRARARSRPAR